MMDLILVVGAFSILAILFLTSVFVGRRVGKWQLKHDPQHKLQIVTVAEGTVFALLGLLIAFTFTGAYERFEARKIHIIEEANAIDTAYLRIGLLAPSTQNGMRQLFRDYLDSRLLAYKKLPDFDAAMQEMQHSLQIRAQLWDQALAACKVANNNATTMLFLPSVNTMFEVAATRLAITKLHPPLVVFILLIGLSVIGSFLAGYSTAANKASNLIHILSYVLLMAFTLYVIIDIEMPRMGLVRVDSFDQQLYEVRASMK